MKITCQSCQSKYNVADEKVQGKIVKIRAANAARRSSSRATAERRRTGLARRPRRPVRRRAARPTAGSGTSTWATPTAHDDAGRARRGVQRRRRHAGDVHLDRRDGRLEAPLGRRGRRLRASRRRQRGTCSCIPAPAEPATYAAPAAGARRGTEDGRGARRRAVAAEPRRAAVVKREARGARDLFGGGSVGGEEVQTSAPVVPADDAHGRRGRRQQMTGQRNENSVLFSLAVLTKDAGSAPRKQRRGPPARRRTTRASSISRRSRRRPSRCARRPGDNNAFSSPLGLAARRSARRSECSAARSARLRRRASCPSHRRRRRDRAAARARHRHRRQGGWRGPAPEASAMASTAPTVTATATAEPSATASATAEASASAPAPSASAAVKQALPEAAPTTRRRAAPARRPRDRRGRRGNDARRHPAAAEEGRKRLRLQRRLDVPHEVLDQSLEHPARSREAAKTPRRQKRGPESWRSHRPQSLRLLSSAISSTSTWGSRVSPAPLSPSPLLAASRLGASPPLPVAPG